MKAKINLQQIPCEPPEYLPAQILPKIHHQKALVSMAKIEKKPFQLLSKFPLRFIIIVPFVVQIFGTVGLVGYFSFRNGQKAVNDLATQLRTEVTGRIHQHLENYIATPKLINQINSHAIIRGDLDPKLNRLNPKINLYLWQQIQLFDSVTWISLGFEDEREYRGIVRQAQDGEIQLVRANQETNYLTTYYNVQSNGTSGEILKTVSVPYDVTQRPWYKTAVKAGKAVWSSVYPDPVLPVLYLTSSQPVYDQTGKLLGVSGVDFNLIDINQFLQNLTVGKHGKTFIIERTGEIIATSTAEPPFAIKNHKIRRIAATESSNILIQSTGKYIQDNFKDLGKIQQPMQLDFMLEGQRQLLQITPFKDELGLDWLSVVVVPESDFMEQININNRNTALLCLAALIIAIIGGLITSRWIIKPILTLNQAAQKLSAGDWNQTLPVERSDELGMLAQSFNSMAQQLQESFVTLESQNEELQRLDKLKDQFLANTSHELRTPLNGMIGIAESMIDGATGELSPIQKQNLAMVAQSGHRLANLVNDILDFSKLRYNNLELQLKPVEIRAIADVVLNITRSIIRHKDLQLINAVPSNLPPAKADENRIQQILHNLIGNAIKFTESGTVEISAKLMNLERPEANHPEPFPYLAITVSDTGIGISEDKFERIFESFEQGDGSTAREYGGTGLGLTVTKQLVDLHQGQIWVESIVGQGSHFTFTLPVFSETFDNLPIETSAVEVRPVALVTTDALKAQPLEIKTIQPLIASKEESEEELKILIVDDEPVNLQVLVNYLSLRNYAVAQASNGAEALELLETGFKPDLILLDVMMPRMTGYEVCQKIRARWPAHELPIMLLTAKNQVSDVVTGLEVGANDYLSKPFHKEELLARVKTHINIAQLQTEKAKIRETFGRYISDEVVDQLLASKQGLNLGGERRKVTILTSDLRGFTASAERMQPEEVVKILNFYFSYIAEVIISYQGTIDEFMGDGILVLFGAPTTRPDDAERAVACAIAMQLAMQSVNIQMEAWGLPPLEMGIGINTGEVVVGNIGSEKRTKYGVVGNHVNITYRIESYTTGEQILIADSTRKEVESIVDIRAEKQVQPKGVKEPITIYDVGGIRGKHNLFMPLKEEKFVLLKKPILIQYTILEGKQIGENLFQGTLVKLSNKGAKIHLKTLQNEAIPAALSNIKLNLFNEISGKFSEDIYGKILENSPESGTFYLRFTSKHPDLVMQLDSLYQQAIAEQKAAENATSA